MSSQKLESLLCHNNPPIRQRRQRTNFNDEAISALDEAFSKNPYPDINEREALSRELKTTEDRIQVWFQNKRARYRKRIQKENSDSKPVKKSKIVLEEESKPTTVQPSNNSTPVSTRLSNRTNDSAYISQTDLDLSKSFYNNYNLNSPMLPFMSHSTPYQYFNPSYYYQSYLDNSFGSQIDSLNNSSIITENKPVVKPFFRPFE